jgi:hypothetical protein
MGKYNSYIARLKMMARNNDKKESAVSSHYMQPMLT